MSAVVATNETILVVGAGVSGITAAVEAAECGKQVILVEQRPFIGGRIAQLYKYFPKLCHPTCGLEINQRRVKASAQLTVLTLAEVTAVEGSAGDYRVTVRLAPRYVNDRCTACGACAEAVEAEFDNEFNYGLDKRKGAYLPYSMAHPQHYVLDPRIIGTPDAERAKAACRYDAIDLDMREEMLELNVGAIVWATGWRPYDAARIHPYGYSEIDNVITSVELERMMDPFGPTGGKLVRPSDGKEAKDVAFIQCAGSRDRNHLRHCSRICCMASLKQSTYLREQFGEDGRASIYYIDMRVIDRFEDFYQRVREDGNVRFIKSKVAKITEEHASGNPVLHGVDTEGYHRYSNSHDLVVLAIGMQPSIAHSALPVEVRVNRDGYIELDEGNGGIFAAGCASDALDVNRSVQSATASALRAVQVVNRVAGQEA
jgi:quinone-modifying oxidoreductase subunit QmoA